MSFSSWISASRSNPCPKCQKKSWCRQSSDGEFLICQRVNDGTGIERTDVNGQTYWLYPNHDRGWSYKSTIEAPFVKPKNLVDPEILNEAYQFILNNLDLSPEHVEKLAWRGLTDQEIIYREYKSLTYSAMADVGNKALAYLGLETCSKIPGLYLVNCSWRIAGPQGIVIPVRDTKRRIIALKIRRDCNGCDSKYIYLSSSKYGGPSVNASVHVPLIDHKEFGIVRLTEGELKADVTTAFSGRLTLGLPGVFGWKQAVPILRELGAKVVRVAFDSDVDTNEHVARAVVQTINGLDAEGFNTEVEQWIE